MKAPPSAVLFPILQSLQGAPMPTFTFRESGRIGMEFFTQTKTLYRAS